MLPASCWSYLLCAPKAHLLKDEKVTLTCSQGICQTAIKKVCRKLGIKKWPYKEMRAPTVQGGGPQDQSDTSSEESHPVAEIKIKKEETAKPRVKMEEVKGGKNDIEADEAVSALLSLRSA